MVFHFHSNENYSLFYSFLLVLFKNVFYINFVVKHINFERKENRMSDITHKQYWDEIESIVETCWTDYDNQTEDNWLDALHEQIDGHQYVIYNAYHYQVLLYSPNEEYGYKNGLMAESYKRLSDCLIHATYWAMYADCVEYFENNKEEIMGRVAA